MSEYTKGDRVSYTVMYGGSPGSHYERTEYGKVTRVQPGGARGEPQATIAVENPLPGAARYVKRYVTDIAAAPAPGSFEDKAARYPGHVNLVDTPTPKGWSVFHDGGLVFSVDSDKWETIGPAIANIMSTS